MDGSLNQFCVKRKIYLYVNMVAAYKSSIAEINFAAQSWLYGKTLETDGGETAR